MVENKFLTSITSIVSHASLTQALRLVIVCIVLCLAFVDIARSQDTSGLSVDERLSQWGEAQVGQGSYRFAFWKIYDIELLAPDASFNPEEDFALKLTYSRAIESRHIVKKSIELIAHQGVDDETLLKDWEQELSELIPDVEKGDELVGFKSESGMEVYFKDALLAETDEPQLANYFFNIWLGEDTTEPSLRKKLLGETN